MSADRVVLKGAALPGQGEEGHLAAARRGSPLAHQLAAQGLLGKLPPHHLLQPRRAQTPGAGPYPQLEDHGGGGIPLGIQGRSWAAGHLAVRGNPAPGGPGRGRPERDGGVPAGQADLLHRDRRLSRWRRRKGDPRHHRRSPRLPKSVRDGKGELPSDSRGTTRCVLRDAGSLRTPGGGAGDSRAGAPRFVLLHRLDGDIHDGYRGQPVRRGVHERGHPRGGGEHDPHRRTPSTRCPGGWRLRWRSCSRSS